MEANKTTVKLLLTETTRPTHLTMIHKIELKSMLIINVKNKPISKDSFISNCFCNFFSKYFLLICILKIVIVD